MGKRGAYRKSIFIVLVSLMIGIWHIGSGVFAGEKTSGTKPGDNNKTEQIKKIVVKVNGAELSTGELDSLMSRKINFLRMRGMPADRIEQIKPRLRDSIVNEFVTRTLISQQADKEKIQVSSEEVDSALSKFKKNIPDGMSFESILRGRGTTEEKFRKEIRLGLRMNKLIKKHTKVETDPSDEEIKDYYTKNKEKFDVPETVEARHILIKVDPNDDEKTRAKKKAKAEAIRKELLKEDADFAKLAKENSDCPSGKSGGYLGSFHRGMMVKPFEDAAFSQKVNEIGPVIETKFGFHIIQVLKHKQAESKSLDDVKDQVKEILKKQAEREAWKKYIEKLEGKATIIYPKAT